MDDKFDDYVANKVQAFEGGVAPATWVIVKALAGIQKAKGIVDPVCEIGVHHGKFIIGLMLAKKSARKSLAIDVFDLQQFNMDNSGHGNLEKFLQNVRECVGDADAVGTIKGDSLSLSMLDLFGIHQQYGKFSMFSVDGCHTAEHTYHDLLTAAQLTCHGGLIFVDDYNHINFPGVQEGVCQYFFKEEPKFAPVCFVGGRLILTDVSHHKVYFEGLRKRFRDDTIPDIRVVEVKRFGWDTLTFAPDRRVRMRAQRAAKASSTVPETA